MVSISVRPKRGICRTRNANVPCNEDRPLQTECGRYRGKVAGIESGVLTVRTSRCTTPTVAAQIITNLGAGVSNGERRVHAYTHEVQMLREARILEKLVEHRRAQSRLVDEHDMGVPGVAHPLRIETRAIRRPRGPDHSRRWHH